MSLLLDALKKAEKAKEDAERQAKDSAGPEGAGSGEAGKHVTTRAELPDISQPLEILSEDLPGTNPAPAASPKAPLEPRAAPPEARSADPQAVQRNAARSAFEAKFKEPNPRLPFYLAVGALGLAAVGVVGYFWYQLRPPPPLVNTNPARPVAEQPLEIAASKPSPSGSLPAQSSAAQTQIPGLPAGQPSIVPSPPPSATPAKPAPAEPRAAEPQRRAAPPAARAAVQEEPRGAVSAPRALPQVHPQVQAGYLAYQSGDLATARTAYEQSLRDEPANRDALLGLAAVEMRAQRYERAEAYYQRLLQMNPRDAHAQAGLLALRSQFSDPVQAESRIKTLLASDPDSSVLYFTLGNQYAQQSRWSEAQQAYFKAFAADSENPDYAFNLAVSLDQLRQSKLALEYYERALALAAKRAASFAPEMARARMQQLSR